MVFPLRCNGDVYWYPAFKLLVEQVSFRCATGFATARNEVLIDNASKSLIDQ